MGKTAGISTSGRSDCILIDFYGTCELHFVVMYRVQSNFVFFFFREVSFFSFFLSFFILTNIVMLVK